jgi:hypothetical protein
MTTVRRAGTASMTVLSGFILFFGLAPTIAPEWIRWSDLWKLREYRDAIREAADESVRIEDEAMQLQASIEASEHIADRLIAGTLSLAEAAEMTEPLVLDRPGSSSAVDWHYPGSSFRQSVARYLIRKVCSILENDPIQLAVTRAHLEAEYVEMK